MVNFLSSGCDFFLLCMGDVAGSVDGSFYVCVSFVFDTAYKKRKVVREPTLR